MWARWGYKLARAIGRPSCRVAAFSPHIPRREREILASDVFAASYPRSGNTWFRQLLSDVLLQLHGLPAGPQTTFGFVRSLIPPVERSNPLEVSGAPLRLHPRVFKTHEFWSRPIRRAIVIYRLPAASLASYYHFHRSRENLRKFTTRGIDAFCRDLAADWTSHLTSYLDALEAGRLRGLLISYERLHAEPVAALVDACRFLGWAEDAAVCQQAVEHIQLKNCRAAKEPQATGEFIFYRKGATHSFLEELPASTIAFLEEFAQPTYHRAQQLAVNSRAVLMTRKSA